ncbi:MAG: serine hydrolase domain-containing protein [Sandaracinaceae bacterium]
MSRLLEAGVAGRVFPGAVACVSFADGASAEERTAKAGLLELNGGTVDERVHYDLAQVTQPFVAMLALRLASRRELDLDAPIQSFVADVRNSALAGQTLRALFEHRGGLAETGGLYLDVPHDLGSPAARRWIVGESGRRRGSKRPGQVERSDLGYIIAGEALARAKKEPLDVLLAREVLEPLGLTDLVVFPGALPTDRRATLAHHVAPTERCPWRGEHVHGDVHDENAAALGGVSGHAGLFATAVGLARFGRAMLDVLAKRSDFLRRDVLVKALAAPKDGDPQRFGWVVAADDKGSPQGRHMSAGAFGMEGFTGCSLYCDPARDLSVALLSNRICPSRANEKIDGFRPAFHDGVVAALG